MTGSFPQENKKVEEASLIREMGQSEGFKLLKKKFEDKIAKATIRLTDINTKDEDVAEIRKKIFVWTEITNMMKSIMITGDYTSKLLQEDFESQSLGFRSEQGE